MYIYHKDVSVLHIREIHTETHHINIILLLCERTATEKIRKICIEKQKENRLKEKQDKRKLCHKKKAEQENHLKIDKINILK